MRVRDSAGAEDVRYARYTPGLPLSPLIGCFWYWEGAPQTHSKERLLPNGECSVIFNLREDPIRIYDAQDVTRFATYGKAVLSGARSDCFVIDTDQQERVVGIQFRAGGAFPFLPVPVCELEGDSFDLADLWPGGRAAEVRERLLAALSLEHMFAELEQCLLAQMVRPVGLHPAVAFALREFQKPAGAARIGAVSARVGLSSRRFTQLFREQVGLTPKVFCRVLRFQYVLHAVHAQREVDWAQIALESGYYDQPHFIHDFEAFSGLTPGEYLAAATPHLNHVPLA